MENIDGLVVSVVVDDFDVEGFWFSLVNLDGEGSDVSGEGGS